MTIMPFIRDFFNSKSKELAPFEERVGQLQALIQGADAILIGAGAGFSAAAGLEYSGSRFTNNFADFIEKYGVQDMYSATFYDYPSEEARWAYWARHILVNRYGDDGVELHRKLHELVANKPHFVITTNVDAIFAKAGFAEDRIFAVQGDYGFNQCAVGCHDTLYPNEELVRKMVAETKDCKVPTALVPRCPVCGGPMDVHVHKDQYFIQGAAWEQACDRYNAFVKQALDGGSLLLIELGVGYNTPGIIRYPFERIVAQYRNTNLVRMNRDYPESELLTSRFLPFTENISQIFAQLKLAQH
jgi:NAD-dependent SIR2 family protein deacetylase